MIELNSNNIIPLIIVIIVIIIIVIQFPLPLKIVPPYTVSSTTSSLTSWPRSLTINILRPATW